MNQDSGGTSLLLSRAWKAIVKAFATSRPSGESQAYGADTTLFDPLRDDAPGRSAAPPASEWDGAGESSYFDPNPRGKRGRR